jgi:uncharacterized protein YkwD
MSISNQFPRRFAFRLRALLLCALFAIFLPIAAIDTRGQGNSARPVARLITSSRQDAAPSSRTRMIAAAPVANVTGKAATITVTEFERRAFDLINEQRRKQGEEPLVWDAELCRMARLHSENMARLDFFSHDGPEGIDMLERARQSGIKGWKALGENIAYNQGFNDPAAFAVEKWMQSAKHRSNILRADFNRSAIGVARATDGRVFFTQVFITR